MSASTDAPEDQGLGGTQMHDAAIDAGLVERPVKEITDDEWNHKLNQYIKDNPIEQSLSSLELEEEHSTSHESEMKLINEIRLKRLNELKQQKEMNERKMKVDKHLKVIQPLEFKEQVTVQSNKGHVILIIFKKEDPSSNILMGLLAEFSQLHSEVVCLSMEISPVLSNLRPSDCPVIMSYKNGKVIKQWTKLKDFNGNSTNLQDLEWAFMDAGIIEDSNSNEMENARRRMMQNKKKNNHSAYSDDEDDDDENSEEDY